MSTDAKRKVDTKWFQQQFQDKAITQRKVAATLGIDPASVSLMLRGMRRMQLTEAEDLAKLIGVPLADVLHHAGIDSTAGTAASVPIVGRVDDENVIHFKRPATGPRSVEAPPGCPVDCVAVRYDTQNELASRDGWVVFFTPTNNVDVEAIGRWAVVDVGGKSMLRLLQRGHTRGNYRLVSKRLARAPEDTDKVRAATPVLWVRCLG